VKREGKGGRIWSMFIIYLYGNRIMKLVEVVLRRGAGDEGE
jgi:hypothetical protein